MGTKHYKESPTIDQVPDDKWCLRFGVIWQMWVPMEAKDVRRFWKDGHKWKLQPKKRNK